MQNRTKRIAKNSVYLYIKICLSTVIGLYTGRVILNVLGVDDFGIYNVVGGIVALFGFLNASMSAATSRFITYEIGTASKERMRDTFSASFMVHVAIAIVVVILCETIGVWMLNNKLVIPVDRMYAAHWVLQLSIVAAAVSITQVPYNACIIAYERMNVFAYIEIVNSILKLLIVFLLVIGKFDKLILYSVLTLVVSLIIASAYRIYCIRNFPECRHLKIVKDRSIVIPLLTFSVWDLYGNGCGTARQQGINFLINMYFGVALNAAAGIANVVSGVVEGFTGSVTQAFRPAIIKNYAEGNIRDMERLMIQSMCFSLFVLSVMVVPLLINTPYVLKLWLKEVPEYASCFTRILLISCVPNIINAVIVTAVHANGRIKYMSFITGTIFLMNIPLLWIWLKLGGSPNSSYLSAFIIMVMVTISNSTIAKFVIRDLRILKYFQYVFKAILIIIVSAILPYLITFVYNEGFISLVIVTLSYVVILALLVYLFGIDKLMRTRIKGFIKRRLCQNA